MSPHRFSFRGTRATWVAAATAFVLAVVVTYVLTGSLVATLLANGIASVVIVLIFAQARDQDIGKEQLASWLLDASVPTHRGVFLAVGVLACGLAMRLGVGFIKAVVSPGAQTATHSATSSPPGSPSIPVIAGLVLSIVIVAPLIEELVFRGVLQRFLSEYVGVVAAVGFVSAAFAVLHVPNYGGFGTPLSALAIPMSVIFADSVLWGWAYYRTGNAAVSWLAHGGSNAIALAMWLS